MARHAAALAKGREQHSIAYDSVRERYVLFGGFGVDGVLGDTWEWDGVRNVDRTHAGGLTTGALRNADGV